MTEATATTSLPPGPMAAALSPDIPEVTPEQVQAAQGSAVEQVFVDYFGFEDTGEFVFPDRQTKIWFKALNEGERSKFQRATNRDVQLERNTGNARVRTDPAGERFELIMSSVTNWNLHTLNRQNGRMEPVPFSNQGRGSTLAQWVERANPKLVDALEEAIRKINPWLVGDMSLEDIEREIERLEDLKKEKIKLEAEKEAFRN